ncbi:MAG: PrsW family intramembrane metalloprotease [Thermoflexus sp.]|uniref:PrsW family glutamic-type intramembrane protease n=1 Tax=Thermoflexus sp. TaxID=1969742 RepID=UPI0025DBBC4D|nr:PrsW family glutamic-type intramembrane protease [Thermoflexus sp.]MCS6962702.1 PrsW family intramembrane metalloprotease [Thermoflexus sp.]MDW8185517.1 PrsW family glutamic-type intramembrane protease [Anaerolineae bacterium]
METSPRNASLSAAEESAPTDSPSTGFLWMGAGALGGGLLVSLWIGLAVLAATLRLPAPSPGLLILGLLMGGGLFREGMRIARGEPDAPFPGAEARVLGRTMVFVFILVGCGAAVEAFAPRLPLLILPFHIGVAILGPWMWFNFLRWRLQTPWSRRAGWWGLGLGSLLVPALALFLEGIAVVMLAVILLAARVLLEGPGFLQPWLPQDFSPERLSMLPVERLIADPWVWIGVLIGAVALVPAMEEALKSLPAALRMRDPTASEASLILYGAIGGAGFALTENLLSWQPGVPWAATAIGRLGTTALHILNGGIMGWAWSRVRLRRFLEGIAAYLLAWLLHSLWNAGAIVLSGALLAPLSVQARALALLPALIGMGLTLLLVIGGLGWALPMREEAEASRPAYQEE